MGIRIYKEDTKAIQFCFCVCVQVGGEGVEWTTASKACHLPHDSLGRRVYPEEPSLFPKMKTIIIGY